MPSIRLLFLNKLLGFLAGQQNLPGGKMRKLLIFHSDLAWPGHWPQLVLSFTIEFK